MFKEAVKSHGYEVSEEIGAGGFGVVFRAHQPSVGRDVAIKIVLPEIARDPLFIQRFEQEARLAAQIEHPNIVPLYDYWQDDARAYLVMRYLSGGSLKAALSHGPYGTRATIKLVDQISGALEAAHRNGVVHRDLKPSNILLDQPGNGYLSDFGIAKHLMGTTVGTPTGAIIGSPAYMSPEQISGGEVTARSDLYSLAMVIFELLSGQSPYGDVEPATMLYMQVNEPLPLACQIDPSLPASVDTVLQKAAAKNPSNRYPSAVDLADAVREALEPNSRGSSFAVSGTADFGDAPPDLPTFLQEELPESRKTAFVARERQLDKLERQLELAIQGHGRVALVTGEAGSGKSALMRAFADNAQKNHGNLLVAWGSCDAFSGAGDPYLPFRDVMSMLTGDVESVLRIGSITHQQALVIWETAPLAINLMVEQGSDLLDVLVSSTSILTRAEATGMVDTGQLKQLQWISNRELPGPGDRDQENLFEVVTAYLRALSAERPLLLFLDDLQWADKASVNLLFHLGRRLTDSRILICGGYRSGELALESSAAGKDLARVFNEFKRIFGDYAVDLDSADKSEGRSFIRALLDAEPNRLDDDFREALYSHTGGQALFTVELLRELKERDELGHDNDGLWYVAQEIDWDVLPARVEGVIDDQLSRLDPELRELLTTASVAGDEFSAQLLARVENKSERQIVRLLTKQAGDGQSFVDTVGEERVGRQLLWHFRFKQSLYQHYLYNQINPFERRMIHGDIAEALEEIYAGKTDMIVVLLARHYFESGDNEKAVGYLLLAGDQARAKYANQEAADFYEKALVALRTQEEYKLAARTLMKLGLTYHTAFDYQSARKAYDEGFALWSRWEDSDLSSVDKSAEQPLRIFNYEPNTLDPSSSEDVASDLIIRQLFSGLVKHTKDLDVVPDVAYSWELLDDGGKYVFHLRDDVSWSDGKALTAHDFEYALMRGLDPKHGHKPADLFFDIRGARARNEGILSDVDQIGAKAIDDQTLVVELEKPAGYFLSVISLVYPLPRHVIEEYGQDWTLPGTMVSNGPFLLRSWERGKSLELERNPLYFGTFRGNVQRVEMRFNREWNEIRELYDLDRLDLMPVSGPTLNDSERARQKYAVDYVSSPWLQTTFVRFDTSRPPFDDIRVRKAFVMAVDREKLADVHMGGYSYPGTGGFVPLGIAGHTPGIGLPYDPTAAKSLLDEAGFSEGQGLQGLELHGSGRGEFAWTREFLHQQWRDNLGIMADWEVKPWNSPEKYHQRWPHVYQGGWVASIPDPDYFLRIAPMRFRVPIADGRYSQLVETARGVMDQEERLSIYKQADQLLIEDASLVPLIYGRRHELVKPWISRYFVSAFGMVNWKDVIIEPH